MSSNFTILSCSDDCTLRVWDIRKADAISIRKSREQLRCVIVKDNFFISAGSCITIWSTDTFEEIRHHSGSIKNICYIDEKKILLAAGWDGIISAWSFNSRIA